MLIKESEIFIKQALQLERKYSKVYKDVDNLKQELPKIAFQNIGSWNKPLIEVPISEVVKKIVWRIRLINSNNNKGKRGGYRVFYCDINSKNSILLLGIYSRADIKEGEYNTIAKELVLAVRDWAT